MHPFISEKLAEQAKQLEETVFKLHQNSQDHAEFNRLGYAWIALKEARQAIDGNSPHPEAFGSCIDRERMDWLEKNTPSVMALATATPGVCEWEVSDCYRAKTLREAIDTARKE